MKQLRNITIAMLLITFALVVITFCSCGSGKWVGGNKQHFDQRAMAKNNSLKLRQ